MSSILLFSIPQVFIECLKKVNSVDLMNKFSLLPVPQPIILLLYHIDTGQTYLLIQ